MKVELSRADIVMLLDEWLDNAEFWVSDYGQDTPVPEWEPLRERLQAVLDADPAPDPPPPPPDPVDANVYIDSDGDVIVDDQGNEISAE